LIFLNFEISIQRNFYSGLYFDGPYFLNIFKPSKKPPTGGDEVKLRKYLTPHQFMDGR